MKLFIWGIGKIATRYMKENELRDDLQGFIQSEKMQNSFLGKKVFSPEEMINENYDAIIVLIANAYEEIRLIAKNAGLDINRFVFLDATFYFDGTNANRMEITPPAVTSCKKNIELEREICNLYPKLAKEIHNRRFYDRTIFSTYKCAYDEIDNSQIVLSSLYDSGEYQNDYFRYRTFELIANELITEGIEGECAEVGVFTGNFSRIINKKFSDKKLYLFDTFEGFDSQEIQKSIQNGDTWISFENGFQNTSVEFVLSRMEYPEMCQIVKGYFPESAKNIVNATYAFVSIDVDLEDSIYESLKYFYPKMNEGGVIFLHDYNNRFFFGVKRAVKKYEREIGKKLNSIPIADQGGTLVIKI